MEKISKRKVIFLTSVFVTVFVIVTALLWSPQIEKEVNTDSAKLLYTLGIEDIGAINSVNIHEDGYVEAIAGDPFLIFFELADAGELVRINFKEPLANQTEIVLYYNTWWGFNDAYKSIHTYIPDETTVDLILDSDKYRDLRLDIDISYALDSIEVYDVDVTQSLVANNPLWFLWATGIAVVATVLMFYLDERKKLSDILAEKLSISRKSLLIGFLTLIGIGVISVVISVIVTGVPNLSLFELYEFVIGTVVSFLGLCGIVILWKHRKNLIENYEKVFVGLLLLAGITIIVTTPSTQSSWDADVHYRLAVESSYLGDAKFTESDIMIKDAQHLAWSTHSPVGDFWNMLALNADYQDIRMSYETGISLAHMPSAIFIAVARLIRLPFAFIYMIGKLANLFAYTALCYFSLKKLKSGKLLFSVIALFPTNVFMASSYSYDYWVTGFSLLGMAYFVAALQEHDKPISTLDTAIMCGAFGLACYPKQVYFPLLLLPFIMPKKKMTNKKKYYLICFVCLAVTIALFLAKSLVETSGSGDVRGAEGISPAGQLAFIFGNIFEYAAILLRFLFTDYLTISSMENYISCFAYVGTAAGTVVVLLLMVIAFLFDKDEPYGKEVRTGWRTRTYVILMYFGGSAMIATALYIVFTAVGSQTIEGCQHRYIIPWIYPLLSVWSLNKIKPLISKQVLYWTITLGSFGLLFFDIYSLFLPRVINI